MKANVIYADDLPLVATTIRKWLVRSPLVHSVIGITSILQKGRETATKLSNINLVVVHSLLSPSVSKNLKLLLSQAAFHPHWMQVTLGNPSVKNPFTGQAISLTYHLQESEEQFHQKLSMIWSADNGTQVQVGDSHQPILTELELRVLELVIDEKSSAEIGEILFKSRRTIEGVRRSIMKKIGVNSPIGMVKWWYDSK